MNAVVSLDRIGRQLPTLDHAHWFLRLPLVAIIMYEGLKKFDDLAGGAEMFGVPILMWTLAALGEILAPAALIVGGFFRNGVGDLITRAAGFGIAFILGGVILIAYWPFWSGYKFHLLMFAGGMYFLARGNNA
ncbi:MAG: DoxX family membrane protein [Pseudomonadota bacterium]